MEQIAEQMREYTALRHEDVRTCGIPDLSLTGKGKTTWWECKYADPYFESKSIQLLTMRRLAYCGFARYIVWQIRDERRMTMIVHPEHLRYELIAEATSDDFDHQFIINYMKRVHEHDSVSMVR